MSTIKNYIEKINYFDKQFVGTIAFRNEEITLPDNSKIAVGIDDGHWILIYQRGSGERFRVFSYDSHASKLYVDQKLGTEEEYAFFKERFNYFMAHARVDELVSILPPEN
ncbi:MAG: hypothetical protein WC901_02100 [Candidatus Margulisiibacteriota bacterium]